MITCIITIHFNIIPWNGHYFALLNLVKSMPYYIQSSACAFIYICIDPIIIGKLIGFIIAISKDRKMLQLELYLNSLKFVVQILFMYTYTYICIENLLSLSVSKCMLYFYINIPI